MAKAITRKSKRRAALVLCQFKDTVKVMIKENATLLVNISNMLKTDVEGVQSMLKRDSQTLFHINVLECISSELGIEINDLKKCVR